MFFENKVLPSAKTRGHKKATIFLFALDASESEEAEEKWGAISYLIDGSVAFVDGDECQIRCPSEEDLFQKELDGEIQLKWDLSEQNLSRLNVGIHSDSLPLHVSDLPDNLQITRFPHQTRRQTPHSFRPASPPVYITRSSRPLRFKHHSLTVGVWRFQLA